MPGDTAFSDELRCFLPDDNFRISAGSVPFHSEDGQSPDEETVRHLAVACAGQLAAGDDLCRLQTALEQGSIDGYRSGFLAGYAAALWLLRFDEDNWFSFQAAHAACAAWFLGESSWLERRELYLFPGVSTGLVFPGLCKAPALPLALDFKHRRAELIAVGLAD